MHRQSLFSPPWLRLVAQWGAPSLIASVQRGTIALGGSASATATINPVNTALAFVCWGGSYNTGATGDSSYTFPKVVLTNSTTVTATITNAYASTKDVAWSVVEFTGALRSIQSGTITVSAGTSATATITEVNLSKAWLLYNGFTTAFAGVMTDVSLSCSSTLTNSTTVTAKYGSGATANAVVTYVVVEAF